MEHGSRFNNLATLLNSVGQYPNNKDRVAGIWIHCQGAATDKIGIGYGSPRVWCRAGWDAGKMRFAIRPWNGVPSRDRDL